MRPKIGACRGAARCAPKKYTQRIHHRTTIVTLLRPSRLRGYLSYSIIISFILAYNVAT